MRRILVLGLMLGLGATAAVADTAGSCSIRAGRTEEKMSFSWERGDCSAGHRCGEGSSDMLWGKWSGITPQDLEHEGMAVDARMKAESGAMRCVGTVHDAAMRGTYSFTPDAAFVKRMEAMGFDDQTPERLQGYAMLDVATTWVKEMKDVGVTEMTAQKLMGLKALKVGYSPTQEELIQMSVFKIDAPFVERMRARGFQNLTIAQLVKIKVFKLDE
jgi:hypothetical protein